jgi:hypothetical protein
MPSMVATGAKTRANQHVQGLRTTLGCWWQLVAVRELPAPKHALEVFISQMR